MPAKSLSLIAKKKLINSNYSTIDFEKSELYGNAVIIKNGNGYQLKGFVCALGSIATCLIDFEIPEDAAWARDTWESLSYSKC